MAKLETSRRHELTRLTKTLIDIIHPQQGETVVKFIVSIQSDHSIRAWLTCNADNLNNGITSNHVIKQCKTTQAALDFERALLEQGFQRTNPDEPKRMMF